MALISGFLVGILSQFLGSEIEPGQSTATGESKAEGVNQFSKDPFLAYTQWIEDIQSYLDDPDPERAERRREEMVDYANSLVPRFEGLPSKLQERLFALVSPP